MLHPLTTEQRVELAKLLILMEVEQQERREILLVIRSKEEANLFLNKLSEKNYEMTPEEVYQASVETIMELQ